MHSVAAIIGGALLVLGSAYALGRAAWRGSAGHWSLELASGSALLSLALFALLVLRWAHPAAVSALCAASIATLAVKPRPRPPRLAMPPWPAAILLPFFLYYFVHALAPEIEPDAAGYHLGLVADWARARGITPRIGFYELLPMGLETLFYPAFLIGGASAAKLVHFGYFVATVPLIAHIGRKMELTSSHAMCAAGLYFLTPAAAIAGSSAYNDAAAAFFAAAAFALLLERRPAPLHAGLAAGFSYGIKVTGLAVIAGVTLWCLARRQWRHAAWAAAGSAACALPWMVRNLCLAGNPLAPLGNRIFPNDAFHQSSEAALSAHLTSYGGVRWQALPWVLGVDGTQLQGLIGPLLFALPLALLASRRKQGRALLAAAFLLLLPWTRNLGSRFLLPALALLAVALAMAAGRRLTAALLAMQMLACSPWAVDWYAGRDAWRLRGFPWKAALRLEPENRYLERRLFEYSFTRRAAAYIGQDKVLDLYGLPFSYLDTTPTGPLSSALFDNMALTLAAAQGPLPERVVPITCRWKLAFVRAVRVRLERPWPGMWSIEEVLFEQRGSPLNVSPHWFLDAWPNGGDAWLAIDRNRATRWYTWDGARVGAFWQAAFDRPIPVDAVTFSTPGERGRLFCSVHVQGLDRIWRDMTPGATIGEPVRRLWKKEASRFLKHKGYRWIVAPLGAGGFAPVGRSLADFPENWGVELAIRDGGLALLRIP